MAEAAKTAAVANTAAATTEAVAETAVAETVPETAVAETVPETVEVKNISKNALYLSCGLVEPEKTGEISYAEYCNLAGTYVEKV
jgi:hypothetical protein